MCGIELRSASGSETRTHTSGTALRPLTYTLTATYGPYKTIQHRGHWVTQGNSADIGIRKTMDRLAYGVLVTNVRCGCTKVTHIIFERHLSS